MFEKKLMMIFIQQSENLDNPITAHLNHSQRQDHITCWTNENKAIGQQFDELLTGQQYSDATNMDFLLTVKT